jgi:DeoR family fructose operon transcriptional repressor
MLIQVSLSLLASGQSSRRAAVTHPGKEELFPSERRQQIVAQARAAGRVDVSNLSKAFGVTTETVRRDLNILEEGGLLRRVHGGAVTTQRLAPTVSERSTSMPAQKRAIARAALAEVPDEGAVLLDAGTTTAHLADVFPGDRDLTVVTNSLPIAETLQDRPRLKIMLLGGRVNPATRATTSGWALAALADVSVDVAFMATSGISARRGLTTPDPDDAAIKQAMIKASNRVIVLADHSKLEREHVFIFGMLDKVAAVITDSGADRDHLHALRARGLPVVMAPGAGESLS